MNISSSSGAGLSVVSELVKQTSLLNAQQCTTAKHGLEFALTAIKTAKSVSTSQQHKLDGAFRDGTLSKDDYDKQINKMKKQFEIDTAPWETYVKKLSQLIEQYPSQSEPRMSKRLLEQSSSLKKFPFPEEYSTSKRGRFVLPSSNNDSSSDSDSKTSSQPISTIHRQVKQTLVVTKSDSSTNTDPLQLSLLSPFPSTPNIVSFTAQTNQITLRVPLQHVNEIAAKQIVLLHDEGHLVRWNDVIWRLLCYFRVQDLGNLAIQRADQISCIDHLIRIQNKINIYLDAYTYWQTMGTLYELEHDLATLFHKQNYNELLLGPLQKQPKIQDLFRLKTIQSIRPLKCADILQYLDQYMTKEYVWKNESEINLEQFFQYIAEQIKVTSVQELGIRMKSAYLSRNCIKAMQANQRKTMETARTHLNEVLTIVAQEEVKKVLRTINDKLGNSNLGDQQRQLYASMEPLDVINDLVDICQNLCRSQLSFRKIFHPLEIISKDSLLRNIFQIAICHGRLALSDAAKQPPKETTISKKTYFSSSSSSSSDTDDEETPIIKSLEPTIDNRLHPTENELIEAFKEQLGSLRTISLALLSRIEQRLCEKYNLSRFNELNRGTFLEYIQQNEGQLFHVDVKFVLSSANHEDNQLIKTIPLEDIQQFLVNILDQSNDQKFVESLVCYHFQVESFEQLGHGSFRSMIDCISQTKKTVKNTFIHYECALLDQTDETCLVKRLTDETSSLFCVELERQALRAIEQCPLLGNLYVDTQWNLRYRSALGKLKPFLVRHFDSINMSTLEIDSVTLLKLSTHPTIDKFKESLYNFDIILTSGQLVSCLVQYGSLRNAPLSLLSNIMQTFLSTILLDTRLYQFLVRVLMRIPFLLVCSIVQRVFLEPLIKLEGSQMKVRERLWTAIDKQDHNSIVRFVQLGEQLGIAEWTFAKKIEQPLHTPTRSTNEIPVINLPPPRSISQPTKIETNFSGDSPRTLIERIRREKFGVGLNLSCEGQLLTDQLKSLVGRSLERLSKELYNTDMHFVLELIQNADDNHYENDQPALLFVIESDSIIIYNNESGFKANHIEALCDIGKSTKGKHKQGYIGQKGIGFKSVFTVSDRPEICSNGYRIYFDALNGPIGYILPNWLDKNDIDSEWTTRISLPLKSDTEMQKHKSRSLTASFNDIHPSLLLFLNRLRSMTIDNRTTNVKQTCERRDILGTSIVEISCEQTIEKWFVIKRQLVVSDELKASSDEMVEATEIALAFPLHEIGNGEKNILLTKQDVCAYLPLRTFGFTFIIQADFEVPSSRQDLLGDSIWNQFLLNEIPALFLASLDSFQHEQSVLPIDALRLFLYFLPVESEIYSNNLFTPVCRSILRSLRSRRFLPVINSQHLHMPSECVLVHDPYIREILNPELLYTHLQLYYLREDLYDHHRRLYELGVHHFDHTQLIDIIKRIFSSSMSIIDKSLLGKWFCCLYRCLNELSLADEQNVLKHVRSLTIFPLVNNQQFISLIDINQSVFFPAMNIHLPKLIENDLSIIDPYLWTNFDENSVSITQVQTLLERLGVRRLTHRAVCEQHIFPIFEDEHQWEQKSDDLRIAYVMYIFNLWSNEVNDMSRLKSIVRLATSNATFKQPAHYSIHFTPVYGNRYDLARDFNGYNWILLSDDYIRSCPSMDRVKFHRFLSELGVNDFLHIESHSENDWICQQFDTLIETRSFSINQNLFLGFQDNWLSFYDKYKMTLSKKESTFFKHLKESIWIPTIRTCYRYDEQTQTIESSVIQEFDRPNRVYIRTKHIERLFDQHVPYIDVQIDATSSFIACLELIQSVTVSDVISMLLRWCDFPNATFCTSLGHMQHVYAYLCRQMNTDELRQLFEDKPIVFVPLIPSDDKMAIVCGRFVHKSAVCWSDPSNLFAKYGTSLAINRFVLEPHYKEQKSIFLVADVTLNPTVNEYVTLLVHIATCETTDQTIGDAFLIFKFLCKNNQLYNPSCSDLLAHKSVFPTRDRQWVSLDDNPLVADNDNLTRLFANIKHMPLIDLPLSDRRGIATFFEVCNVKSLSSAISIECIVEQLSDGVSIQNVLAPLVVYIQLFMASRPEFSDAYQWTKSVDMHSILATLQISIVDYLQLIYRLKYDPTVSIVAEEKCYYDVNRRILYIHREWAEQSKHRRDIFHHFARIFVPNESSDELVRLLGNFISLLYDEENNNLETFAKYQNFDLQLKHDNEVPWQMPCTMAMIERVEPKIDESKVQALLANIAEDQEHYKAYRQKKRQELKKSTNATGSVSQQSHLLDAPNDPDLHLDRIHSVNALPISDTPLENIEQHSRNFNLDDLTHQVLDNRDSTLGSNQQSLERIGRWGEQWVNEYLRSRYRHEIDLKQIEVIWLNENIEQGHPYDFILKSIPLKTTTYIEVKSTLSNNRQLIPITFNELQYCCSLPSSSLSSDIKHFEIFRVYNTGRMKKVQLRVVQNVEEKLRTHALELFLLI